MVWWSAVQYSARISAWYGGVLCSIVPGSSPLLSSPVPSSHSSLPALPLVRPTPHLLQADSISNMLVLLELKLGILGPNASCLTSRNLTVSVWVIS